MGDCSTDVEQFNLLYYEKQGINYLRARSSYSYFYMKILNNKLLNLKVLLIYKTRLGYLEEVKSRKYLDIVNISRKPIGKGNKSLAPLLR